MLGLVSEDGTAQVTPVWIMLDGDTPVFNTVDRPPARSATCAAIPRVTLTIVDPDDVYSYVELRGHGRVRGGQAAYDTIDALAKKYIDQDTYPWNQPGARARQLPPDRRARARGVMSDRPIRIGVRVAPQHCTYKQMRDAWLRAEDAGRRHALHVGSLLPALRRSATARTSSAGACSPRWPRRPSASTSARS